MTEVGSVRTSEVGRARISEVGRVRTSEACSIRQSVRGREYYIILFLLHRTNPHATNNNLPDERVQPK